MGKKNVFVCLVFSTFAFYSCASLKMQQKPAGDQWETCPICSGCGYTTEVNTTATPGYTPEELDGVSKLVVETVKGIDPPDESQKFKMENDGGDPFYEKPIRSYPQKETTLFKCDSCKTRGWLDRTRIEYFAAMEQTAPEAGNGEAGRLGIARLIFKNGDSFIGNWVDYRPSGLGLMRYANGEIYFGSWNGYERQGDGVLITKKKKKIKGEWDKDILVRQSIESNRK